MGKGIRAVRGTGHAGVGSVFDLSNAAVAKVLDSKVVIVTQGGIGKPIDEAVMNHALFEREGVDVIGVILNKVLPEKIDYITEFAKRGLKRKGLELLGVVPYQPILPRPTLDLLREELKAEVINASGSLNGIVDSVIIGAMSAGRAKSLFRPGVMLICPADREDILTAAAEWSKQSGESLAGIALSDDVKPSDAALKQLRSLPFPVLSVPADSYVVASRVHDLTVKTRPEDAQKIRLIQDIIAKHVRLDRILDKL
jgi:BioD-like phosphotransacetylase family protein